MSVEVIVWIIVLGIVVFIIYTMLGIVSLFLTFLNWLFRKNKPLPAQSSPQDITTEETKGDVEEPTDDDNAEKKGEESSAVQDAEDSGEE